ncbi:hypothetical protein BGX26_002716 [Mortierella sp. AD094]|nr:hypothetical protein BGX26_002716 [Mortierella sp. AD094]
MLSPAPSGNSTANSSHPELLEIPAENSTDSTEAGFLSQESEHAPSTESPVVSNHIREQTQEPEEDQGYSDEYESAGEDSDSDGEVYVVIEGDIDMSAGAAASHIGSTSASTSSDEHDQGQELDMQDDEEFVMELDPATGQRRATTIPTSTLRARSSSLASRLRRQHRRMTTSVRFTATARPATTRPSSSGSNRSAAGFSAPTSTRTTATVPLVDENAQNELRKKIMDIQRNPAISFGEKASMIQRLMSPNWHDSRKAPEQQSGGDSGVTTEEDLKTTYHDQENGVLGCKHYKRGCKLKANCCGKWFNCRFCHDDVCDHSIVRNETKMMLCMHCKVIQSAAQNCCSCQAQMAHYFCDVCKLWDDDSQKPIYHCDDCGICRIGNGLNQDFFHCKKCNICMHINLKDNHKCIERNLECDCPICGEYMFTSTTTVIFMPCGHSIHAKCHEEYVKTSYQCPTCWKALADMSRYYQKIDSILAEQTMPPEYANIFSTVLCNDCEVKSQVPYHFLYHKCDKCKGYNTKVLETFRRETEDKIQLIENTAAASTAGTVPENNISGAGSTAAGQSSSLSSSPLSSSSSSSSSSGSASFDDSGSTMTRTTVHLPEIPRAPLLDGNASGDMGFDSMAGSSGNSAP